MSYLRDRVIVLKKEPFREQDRRYTAYGREHGLLVAVARGSSARLSKQAGHLEPFTEADVMIAKGTAFDKLVVARMHASYFTPRSPFLASFAVCGGMADLVIRLTRPGMADERIFDLLSETISVCAALPQEPSPERARLFLASATLKLLDLVGFAPPIAPAASFTTPVPHLALLAFIRRSPLADILRVTAPVHVFDSASAFVEEALEESPLESEHHGPRTIQALLRTD